MTYNNKTSFLPKEILDVETEDLIEVTFLIKQSFKKAMKEFNIRDKVEPYQIERLKLFLPSHPEINKD